MNTQEAVEIIKMSIPKKTSIISSLGRTSEIVFHFFPANTLFVDSMGDVSSLACGISLGVGKTNPVVVFDTDGSHLMGLNLLPTLSFLQNRLSNLMVIVFDNGIYESAGGIESRLVNLDWKVLGEAWKIKIDVANNKLQLKNYLKDVFKSFLYIIVKVNNQDCPIYKVQKSLDGIESKYIFSRHLERVLGKLLLKPAIKA